MPSMYCFFSVFMRSTTSATPTAAARLVNMSWCAWMPFLICPGLILAGQRNIEGTRTPPS
ncbi:hypothetical protein D9M69_737260 [compost metagenome]